MGTLLCSYEKPRDGAIVPPRHPAHPELETDTVPEARWDCSILEGEGEQRFGRMWTVSGVYSPLIFLALTLFRALPSLNVKHWKMSISRIPFQYSKKKERRKSPIAANPHWFGGKASSTHFTYSVVKASFNTHTTCFLTSLYCTTQGTTVLVEPRFSYATRNHTTSRWPRP